MKYLIVAAVVMLGVAAALTASHTVVAVVNLVTVVIVSFTIWQPLKSFYK
jgi:hypothetical protein